MSTDDFEMPKDRSRLLTGPEIRRAFWRLANEIEDDRPQTAAAIRSLAGNLWRRQSELPVARKRHGNPSRDLIIDIGREKYASVKAGTNVSDRALSIKYETSTRVISHIIAGRRDGKPIWTSADGQEMIYKFVPGMTKLSEEPWDADDFT